MGACCGGLFQDDAGMNPKLRPPSLLGVLFVLISMFCFIISVTTFHLSVESIYMSVGLAVFYMAVSSGEGSAWERKYPSMIFLTPIFILSALLPFYLGVKLNVKIYAPYYLAESGREYNDVPANSRTAEYADAGILHFRKDATLDTSRAFGYMGDDFTYCVAPVVSRDDEIHPHSGGPKITFWAVGKDCCGNRKDYECDGAGETEVSSAFTVRDVPHSFITKLLVPKTSRPEYLKAVKAAKSVHNLRTESDDQIILVRWAADPKETLQVWNNRALLGVVVSCVIYSIIIIAVWATIHWWFDSDIRKIAGLKGIGAQSDGRQVKDPFMLGGGVV